MEQGTLKQRILLVFKGMLVGSGAILPGISGGVLCVAFGIYEPMMALLAHPVSSFNAMFMKCVDVTDLHQS